jgi:hypothetical protein
MADQLRELADLPKEFLRDGTQFLNRCTKRTIPANQNPMMSAADYTLSG